jgi:uncharacterized sulfatase
MYPQLLRERGYYCINNSKEDYNLAKRGTVWDASSKTAHYRNRQPNQPFFAAFNMEITHESQIRTRPHAFQHRPESMRLPAYHPDTPEVRQDWAQYYDNITTMDGIVGSRLQELEEAGLADDTIVFFYGDNGSGMPRSKRWPYNSGLNVPLIVFVPEKYRALAPAAYRPGGESGRLVGFVDFAPTLVSIAGTKPPEWMQGRAFMGAHPMPDPAYAFGLRGRMDERQDLVRSVRNQRYVYIRNYMPHLIYGQYLEYMFETPTTRVWRTLYDQGKLKPPQSNFWQPKPAEELYDLEADPDEVTNLAGKPEHAALVRQFHQTLRDQLLETRDLGFLPEAEMHKRASGSTPYEMGHDSGRYPLEKVLAMAETASTSGTQSLPALKTGLSDSESGIRYWAAMGVLMRGKPGLSETEPEIRAALNDSSPSVRLVAANILGLHGTSEDLARALEVLKELAPPDKNGAYISIAALNVIGTLGPKAAVLKDTIETMSLRDPAVSERVNNYVPRIVSELTGRKAAADTPAAKKAKAGKKKQP